MTATIVGAKELERLLLTLPDKAHRRVVRKAVNKSTTGMVKAARKLAPASEPSDTDPDAGREYYRKSLRKKLKSYFADGVVVSVVGADVSKKFKGHGNLSHLLEHGHATRGGGRARAFPHLEPAFRATVSSAAAKMTSEIARGIEHEAKKL